jgi:integral membrane protein
VAKYVGLVHGIFFYPLFLLVTLLLGIRTRMPMVRLLTAMVLGTVPFLSFWAERETTRWVQQQQQPAG